MPKRLNSAEAEITPVEPEPVSTGVGIEIPANQGLKALLVLCTTGSRINKIKRGSTQ